MTMLLIDGDILLYQACASAEKEVEWEEDIFSLWTNLSDAKDNFVTALASIMIAAKEQVDITSHHICLTDSATNWRKDVYPDYKASRKSTRKPLGYRALRDWVSESYPVVFKPRLEADDCIGILATKPGNDALIWTIDKDLKQIPGKHLVDGEVVTRDVSECDKFFLTQTLTGDATDGYPGCKGIGAVKAEKLIVDRWHKTRLEPSLMKWMWQMIVDTYAKAGFTEEYALTQARVARICRWEDWNQDKQEVILWSPR